MDKPQRRLRSMLLAAAVLVAAGLPVPADGALSLPPAATAEASSWGYWLVAGDGGIFSYGGARFFGSTGDVGLNQPVVGMAATSTGHGYWMVAADGGIFSYGDAAFYRSMGAVKLNRPIVGMAATRSGRGYWLVASDGGIFSFGDAAFFGSTGAMKLNRPIVGMAATRSGRGYWLVASDGGIFSFGDAAFLGSTGALPLNEPITGMAATPGPVPSGTPRLEDGEGYWLVASDGGVFSFGDAAFLGSAAPAASRVVSIVPTGSGRGYWQVAADGEVFAYGDAPDLGSPEGLNQRLVAAAAPRPAPTDPGGPTTSTTTTPPATTPTTSPGPPARPAGRPNILVINTDDQRADTMDVMPKTRRWFHDGGTVFPEGFATTPLCCPSRSTLFSGRYMHNHTVFTNDDEDKLDKDWTIARYLRDGGYTTAIVGKFLVGWNDKDAPPHFDYHAVTLGGYDNAHFNVDGDGQTAAYSTDFIAEQSVRYLDTFEATDDGKPWFLYVAPQAPHREFIAAPEYADAPVPAWEPSPAVTEEDKSDKNPYVRDNEPEMDVARAEHDGQLRTLLSVDDMVDDIFRKLEAAGELDNTLAIYTSDNGFSWGERGVGSKGLPYTESVKVPFAVRWTGVVPAGAVDTRLVANVDILPTALDAAGVTPPELRYPLDGRSLLASGGRDRVLLEFAFGHRGIPDWASLRTGTSQYIEYYEADTTTVAFREHYDLDADPYQLENLLADADPGNDPDVAAMTADLAAARHCAGYGPAGGCP